MVLYRMGTGNGSGGGGELATLTLSCIADSVIHLKDISVTPQKEVTKVATSTSISFEVLPLHTYVAWQTKDDMISAETEPIKILDINVSASIPNYFTATISGTFADAGTAIRVTDGSRDFEVVKSGNSFSATVSHTGEYSIIGTLNGIEQTHSASITSEGQEITGISIQFAFISITLDNSKNEFLANEAIVIEDSLGGNHQEKNCVNYECMFTIAKAGKYTIAYSDNGTSGQGKARTKNVTIALGDNINITLKTQPELVSFASATDEQINEICEAYYDDPTFLTEIEKVWSVGNEKTINGKVYRIIGMAHDDLADDSGKALLTLQSKDSVEKRAMNSTNTNVGGWNSCAMRTYLNGTFFNSVKSAHPSLNFKTVKKLTSAGNTSSTINSTNDNVSLLSEKEIFGAKAYSFNGEGSQYEFYKNGGSKIKNIDGSADYWWERSPGSSDAAHFCLVNSSGTANRGNASLAFGVAPALYL